MKKFSKRTILIIALGSIVMVLGALYFIGSKSIKQTAGKGEGKQNVQVQEMLSIAGAVKSVDAKTNSFVVVQTKENASFKVTLGKDTDFVRVVFPFDINNPPKDGSSFTPKREPVSIGNLKVGDQVFVRSVSVIKVGQDIINPLEVQILP